MPMVMRQQLITKLSERWKGRARETRLGLQRRCHDSSSFSQCLFNYFSRHRGERQRIIELVEKLEQLNPERSSIAML